jgi:regulator of Ty1 transposition protein 109
VLADKKYEKATEMLLRLDFADREAAALSTQTWIDELAVLGGVDGTWGREVIGRKAVEVKVDQGSGSVNVLGVKRKSVDATSNGNGATNVLNAGLIRKKLKVGQSTAVQETAVTNDSATPGVNVLSAGLVRKKPKKIQPTSVSLNS